MSKQYFIGANWKMNPPPKGSLGEGSPYFSTGEPQIVVFPTFIDLRNCIHSGQLIVGAQCGRAESNGAFTGDIGISLLKEFGCSYVLCGHSERRQHHGETDDMVAAQVSAALECDLIPVLCIGETAEQHERKETEETLKRQLSGIAAMKGLTSENLMVAYEPVWAIGTGKTPSPTEANAVHAFIKSLLPKGVRVIYGGSVNGKNAASFFSQPNIDGALVGGASLKPEEFAAIVKAAEESSV